MDDLGLACEYCILNHIFSVNVSFSTFTTWGQLVNIALPYFSLKCLILSLSRLWAHCPADHLGSVGDHRLCPVRHSAHPAHHCQPGRLHGHRLPLPLQEHLLRPVLFVLHVLQVPKGQRTKQCEVSRRQV